VLLAIVVRVLLAIVVITVAVSAFQRIDSRRLSTLVAPPLVCPTTASRRAHTDLSGNKRRHISVGNKRRHRVRAEPLIATRATAQLGGGGRQRWSTTQLTLIGQTGRWRC
jgi:hypothetical protein